MELARSTRLNHPLGATIVTPLLVPSFSSKGFGYDKQKKSEIKNVFGFVSEYLTEGVLVSAYDLHYKHIPFPKSAITEFTIIDSGGYEISDFHDFSTIYRQSVKPNSWNEGKLKGVYDRWPKRLPAIFVNFDHPDHRFKLSQQVDSARRLFQNYPNQLHTLLIKPESKTQKFLPVEKLLTNIRLLSGFNVLGFTEKELGNSILLRMVNISKIRMALDSANITAPIHVFGSLDPITSVLYFLSGAEIFDGLTWLRFGFASGLACYQQNFGVTKIGLSYSYNDDFVKAKTIQENYNYLIELTHQMKKYLLERDFNKFELNSDVFRKSFDLLKTQLGGVQNG